MARIVFTLADGTRREIVAATGVSLMEAAVQNGVQGIVALCGGACACATCHVYIGEAWRSKLPPLEDMEEGMLEAAFEPRANSRLSCQIPITDNLDGLEVTLPPEQG